MHELAFDMGKEQLEAARSRRRGLDPKEKLAQLRKELQPMLGDIEPVAGAQVEKFWTRSLAGAEVEAISLTVEMALPCRFCCYGRREDSRLQWCRDRTGRQERFISKPLERNRSAVTKQA